MNSTVVKHIEATPKVCGGKPRIAGTRIRVQDIYIWHELHGLSADEIVDAYPHLILADVYAALAYYHDHRDDIHHAIAHALRRRGVEVSTTTEAGLLGEADDDQLAYAVLERRVLVTHDPDLIELALLIWAVLSPEEMEGDVE